MDPNTTTIFGVAAGLTFSLCVVLAIFSRFHPGTPLIRHWLQAIALVSAGFIVGSARGLWPRWETVLLANLLLMSGGPILHAGFTAYCLQRPARSDRLGWAILAASVPAFWYWGFVEPNGNYRTAAFSLAVAAVVGRTVAVLAGEARKRSAMSVWAMAVLFSALTAWMVVRGGFSLIDGARASAARAVNPTTWMTVFWFIAIISAMSIVAMWMEVSSTDAVGQKDTRNVLFAAPKDFPHKIMLLWSAIVVQIVATIGLLGVIYSDFFATEKENAERTARLILQASARHALQVVGQVDSSLRSVRSYLMETGSTAKTEQFIQALGLDRQVVNNIYVIDAAGVAIVAPDQSPQSLNFANRDYFLFHRTHSEDQVHFTPVERGAMTGKYHFRITRRIDGPDGVFAGLVFASVSPRSFAQYFDALQTNEQAQSALFSIEDRKLLARIPEPDNKDWEKVIASPLWGALQRDSEGSYRDSDAVSGVIRTFLYMKLDGVPLVVTTGFSDSELVRAASGKLRVVIVIAFMILGSSLVFALFLTIEAKRRDEQDRFMSMLSHELRTPLSVIRMAMGAQQLPTETATRVERAVSDIRDVIDRCLQTDRLTHGRIAVSLSPCRVEDALKQIQTRYGDSPLLIVDAEALPTCSTDRQLLDTILHNLVDNAFKYAAPGTPIVIRAVNAVRQRRPGIAISVANAPGPAGMPDPRQVFAKYYRAPGAHSKTGSGLGLHIASGMARMIGGSLAYLPTNNEVRFELWIPA